MTGQQPLNHDCPYCKVLAGRLCKTRSWGQPMKGYHSARVKSAARAKPSETPVPDLNIRTREGARLMSAAETESVVDEEEFPATWDGGHALVVEYGDCEFIGRCQCGKPLATIRPNQSLDEFGLPWEKHVMTEVGR